MTSTLAFTPQTPSQTRVFSFFNDHRPTKSSPLAPVSFPPSSSPGPVSPVMEVQARRKGQFKQRGLSSTSVASLKSRGRFRKGPTAPIPFILGPATPEAGQTAFLRERFKSGCLERARRARERNVTLRRASASSDMSSDGGDVDMMTDGDENEEDNAGFDDELFRRIIVNEERKRIHAYALSYELDVGSSFDPDMEDPTSWEQDLISSSTPSSKRQQCRITPEEDGPPAPGDTGEVSDFDEFDFDEECAWFDACIAGLPLGTLDAQTSVPSESRQNHTEHQQMDITMD